MYRYIHTYIQVRIKPPLEGILLCIYTCTITGRKHSNNSMPANNLRRFKLSE